MALWKVETRVPLLVPQQLTSKLYSLRGTSRWEEAFQVFSSALPHFIPSVAHYNMLLAIAAKSSHYRPLYEVENYMVSHGIPASEHTISIFMAASLRRADWVNALDVFTDFLHGGSLVNSYQLLMALRSFAMATPPRWMEATQVYRAYHERGDTSALQSLMQILVRSNRVEDALRFFMAQKHEVSRDSMLWLTAQYASYRALRWETAVQVAIDSLSSDETRSIAHSSLDLCVQTLHATRKDLVSLELWLYLRDHDVHQQISGATLSLFCLAAERSSNLVWMKEIYKVAQTSLAHVPSSIYNSFIRFGESNGRFEIQNDIFVHMLNRGLPTEDISHWHILRAGADWQEALASYSQSRNADALMMVICMHSLSSNGKWEQCLSLLAEDIHKRRSASKKQKHPFPRRSTSLAYQLTASTALHLPLVMQSLKFAARADGTSFPAQSTVLFSTASSNLLQYLALAISSCLENYSAVAPVNQTIIFLETQRSLHNHSISSELMLFPDISFLVAVHLCRWEDVQQLKGRRSMMTTAVIAYLRRVVLEADCNGTVQLLQHVDSKSLLLQEDDIISVSRKLLQGGRYDACINLCQGELASVDLKEMLGVSHCSLGQWSEALEVVDSAMVKQCSEQTLHCIRNAVLSVGSTRFLPELMDRTVDPHQMRALCTVAFSNPQMAQIGIEKQVSQGVAVTVEQLDGMFGSPFFPQLVSYLQGVGSVEDCSALVEFLAQKGQIHEALTLVKCLLVEESVTRAEALSMKILAGCTNSVEFNEVLCLCKELSLLKSRKFVLYVVSLLKGKAWPNSASFLINSMTSFHVLDEVMCVDLFHSALASDLKDSDSVISACVTLCKQFPFLPAKVLPDMDSPLALQLAESLIEDKKVHWLSAIRLFSRMQPGIGEPTLKKLWSRMSPQAQSRNWATALRLLSTSDFSQHQADLASVLCTPRLLQMMKSTNSLLDDYGQLLSKVRPKEDSSEELQCRTLLMSNISAFCQHPPPRLLNTVINIILRWEISIVPTTLLELCSLAEKENVKLLSHAVLTKIIQDSQQEFHSLEYLCRFVKVCHMNQANALRQLLKSDKLSSCANRKAIWFHVAVATPDDPIFCDEDGVGVDQLRAAQEFMKTVPRTEVFEGQMQQLAEFLLQRGVSKEVVLAMFGVSRGVVEERFNRKMDQLMKESRWAEALMFLQHAAPVQKAESSCDQLVKVMPWQLSLKCMQGGMKSSSVDRAFIFAYLKSARERSQMRWETALSCFRVATNDGASCSLPRLQFQEFLRHSVFNWKKCLELFQLYRRQYVEDDSVNAFLSLIRAASLNRNVKLANFAMNEYLNCRSFFHPNAHALVWDAYLRVASKQDAEHFATQLEKQNRLTKRDRDAVSAKFRVK